MDDPARLKTQAYCRSCGRMSFVPCEDCIDGQCAMNCGPGMVDVRGILKAAIEEYEASEELHILNENEKVAIRDGVRGIMVRLGLYDSFQRHLKDLT